jgi:flagellar hook-length control protein FliK
MILASQAQKDAPQVVQPTAQVNIKAAQIDLSAFNLLLAFVNTGANESAEAAVDFTDDLGTDPSSDDLGKDSLADQAALAAKIADWLASNPASLAVLRGLASGAGGASSPGGSELLLNALGAGDRGQQINAVLALGPINPQVQALLPKLALGGQTMSFDGAEQGAAFVSAIEQARDSHSMAAALMAAVSAGLGKGTSANKAAEYSNFLLAHEPGDLVIPGLLTSALTDGRSSTDFRDGLSALNLGISGASFVKTGPEDSGLGSGLSRQVPPPIADQTSSSRVGAGLSTDEQKRRQLEQVDALLSIGLPGTTQGLDGLRQAMIEQIPGRASIVNANALEGTVSWLASQHGGSATIDLSPPELGGLRLELKIDAAGESAVLIVHAANEAAKAAIEQSLDRLYESFQSAGMALQVSVGSGSSQFAGMFSNGFDDRSKQIQGFNPSPDGSRVAANATTSRASGVATDALSLYA